MENKLFYRVCHKDTLQGLWYDYKGNFTGLIHNEFDFCTNSKLAMDFDEDIVGWVSATDSLESLYNWFSVEDIIELQKQDYYIHIFESKESRFYERFQHLIINQETSKSKEIIFLSDLDV